MGLARRRPPVAAAASLVLLPVGLALSSPARGQDVGVERRSFTYLGSRLTVQVRDSVPGVVRLARGQGGEVRVLARARGGFATAALDTDGPDELNLTSVGARRAEYLVIVPSRVRIEVRLPGKDVDEDFGRLSPTATFSWDAVEAPEAERGAAPTTSDAPTPATPFLAYEGSRAPARVQIPVPGRIRTLTVRIEGDRFRVTASRPLEVTPGDGEVVEIAPTRGGLDVGVELPDGPGAFTLRIGGVTALVVESGRARALCAPVTSQRLPGGVRVFTFDPASGDLECPGS